MSTASTDDTAPTLADGTEYTVIYADGPSEGQTDLRVVRGGTWANRIEGYIAVDASETVVVYQASSWREIGGKYQVTYRYVEGAGDPIEDLEDRGEF